MVSHQTQVHFIPYVNDGTIFNKTFLCTLITFSSSNALSYLNFSKLLLQELLQLKLSGIYVLFFRLFFFGGVLGTAP